MLWEKCRKEIECLGGGSIENLNRLVRDGLTGLSKA